MEQYLWPFLISFFLSGTFLFFVVFFSKKFPLSRFEKGRKHKELSRFGGVALLLAFVVSVLVNTNLEMTLQLAGLLVGAGLVFLVGMWDDLVPLPWSLQLLFQSVLGGMLFVFDLRAWVITNPFGDPILLHPETIALPSFLIGLIWMILVINAVNFSDGIDGLLGGVAVVAFLSIFFVSLRPEVNQPTIAILAISAVGFSFAFLLFNFPPAKILAGTTGAYGIGFLIAALSLFAGAKIATAFLVLAVPILDAIAVVCSRIYDGVSPFQGGDERHLHNKLRSLGWSDKTIAVSYTIVSALAAWAALSLDAFGKLFFLLALAAFFFSFTFSIKTTTPALRGLSKRK